MRTIHILVLLWLGLLWTPLYADLELVIDKSGDDTRMVLLMPAFEGGDRASAMHQIIQDDLERSGGFRFAGLPANIKLSPFGGSVDPAQLKSVGAEFLLRGKITPTDNTFSLDVEIIDLNNGKRLTGFRTGYHQKRRRMAHQMADAIYKQFTGVRGAFDTKIAYVAAGQDGDERLYQLIVADADGYDPYSIVTGFEPITSVAWGPRAKQLAYVSFESGRPAVYVQDLQTGERKIVSARKGINGAPAWSRDGKRLALSLSVEGNPEIYILDLASGDLQRITHSRAIDTEPEWTTDGGSLVFTSDRGGSPQLYRVGVNGSARPRRLTFEGKYNSAASIQGQKMAMVRQSGSKFAVALMDLSNQASEVISRGGLDESPSLAPNGSMVLYETRGVGRKHILSVVSGNGLVSSVLYSPYKSVGHPAWSPYLQ